MKRFLSILAPLLLVLCLNLPAASPENPFGISPDLDRKIQAGLHELYGLRFERADNIFSDIDDQSMEHPMVAFGHASVYWWKLSVNVLEVDPQESRPFLKSVRECIRASKEKIRRGDTTGEGYLTLGGAYGMLGRWEATNRHWLAAYFDGRDAQKALGKALKINPNMTDAFLGQGIFDYYVATLPSVVRSLAFLGGHNNKEAGLDELRQAAEKGIYSRTPARLFLADILANQENRVDEAFKIFAELRQEFPQSPFVQTMEVTAEYNHDLMDDLRKEVASFQQRVADHTYGPQFECQGNFMAALIPFKLKDWPQAEGAFQKAIDSGAPRDPFYTWACLYKGYALDAEGRRAEAVEQYRSVLHQMRRWASYDHAKARLHKPFGPDDIEIKTLKL